MLRVGSLTSTQATLIGLFAPICWGMSVSLVRGIAEGFGMAQGQFFLYCVATICVFFRKIREETRGLMTWTTLNTR